MGKKRVVVHSSLELLRSAWVCLFALFFVSWVRLLFRADCPLLLLLLVKQLVAIAPLSFGWKHCSAIAYVVQFGR